MGKSEHAAATMAWLEGREDGSDPAVARRSCPFPADMPQLVQAWAQGYDEARRELIVSRSVDVSSMHRLVRD
jgi:hypothetical protein